MIMGLRRTGPRDDSCPEVQRSIDYLVVLGGRNGQLSTGTGQGDMRWCVSIAILAPLLVGGTARQTEPDYHYPKLADCPFAVDPNLVVGKLLACLQVEVGHQLIHTRPWHDPDGDPAQVRILKGPPGVQIVNRPYTHSYTILWTPRQIQTCALVVQITDQPAHGKPLSDTGTILVQVVPRGHRLAAHGCGGLPG